MGDSVFPRVDKNSQLSDAAWNMNLRQAAITGAAGYIGSKLCELIRREGYAVLELRRDVSRREPDSAGRAHYDLRHDVDPATLRGVELLVHCAHDFGCRGLDEMRNVNFDGSIRLFDAARAAGVRRTVFVSSMSSFDGCRSEYGRVKLATEAEAARRGVLIVRPGLVFGAGDGGMVGTLFGLVRDRTILPLVGSGNHQLYLCHVEDLCGLVLEAAQRSAGEIRSPLLAAAEQPPALFEAPAAMGRPDRIGPGVVAVGREVIRAHRVEHHQQDVRGEGFGRRSAGGGGEHQGRGDAAPRSHDPVSGRHGGALRLDCAAVPLPTRIVPSAMPAGMTPSQVSREFHRRLEDGARLRPVGVIKG